MFLWFPQILEVNCLLYISNRSFFSKQDILGKIRYHEQQSDCVQAQSLLFTVRFVLSNDIKMPVLHRMCKYLEFYREAGLDLFADNY